MTTMKSNSNTATRGEASTGSERTGERERRTSDVDEKNNQPCRTRYLCTRLQRKQREREEREIGTDNNRKVYVHSVKRNDLLMREKMTYCTSRQIWSNVHGYKCRFIYGTSFISLSLSLPGTRTITCRCFVCHVFV